MKILFVAHLLPHPKANHASAFWGYEMLKGLARKHDVSVAAFVRSPDEAQQGVPLLDFCTTVETVVIADGLFKKASARAQVLRGIPMMASYSYNAAMRRTIRNLMRHSDYDVVQMDHTLMGQYVSEAKAALKVIHVLDLMFKQSRLTADNLPFSRRKLEWFMDSVVAQPYELQLYERFDHVLAVSPKICDELVSRNPSLRVSVLPIGVSIPSFERIHASGIGRDLVFMGAMWRRPNVDAVMWFYESVFERIRRALPETRLHILGGEPAPAVQRLTRDPHVRVSGYVEDLSARYLDCDVSVAPMRIPGGVQCKVLDAMSIGLPVVATTAGNEGVGAADGQDILIADTPEAFAESTISLLKDGRARSRIGRNGREFVRRRFSWSKVLEDLESIYGHSLIDSRARS